MSSFSLEAPSRTKFPSPVTLLTSALGSPVPSSAFKRNLYCVHRMQRHICHFLATTHSPHIQTQGLRTLYRKVLAKYASHRGSYLWLVRLPPTHPLYNCLFLAGLGEKIKFKCQLVKMKIRRLLANNHHRQNRFNPGKTNLSLRQLK